MSHDTNYKFTFKIHDTLFLFDRALLNIYKGTKRMIIKKCLTDCLN